MSLAKSRGSKENEKKRETKFEYFLLRWWSYAEGEGGACEIFIARVYRDSRLFSLSTPTSASTVASHLPFIFPFVMVGDDRSDILGGDKLPVGRYQPPSYWSTLSGVARFSLYSLTVLLSALFLRTFYHRFLRWRETNYRK